MRFTGLPLSHLTETRRISASIVRKMEIGYKHLRIDISHLLAGNTIFQIQGVNGTGSYGWERSSFLTFILFL